MKEKQRVIVFTRYYWPTTNDQTLRLRRQVGQLSAAGFSPHVVSPRWHRSWPQEVNCEEVPVHRIDQAPTNHLKQSKYARAITEWLAKNVDAGDLIYCDSADIEAYTITSHYCKPSTLSRLSRETKIRPKIIVRFDPSELANRSTSDWQLTERNLEVCRLADSIVVPSAYAHQQLVATGTNSKTIRRIIDPIGKPIERSAHAKENARRILTATNHDLFARPRDRVIVCPGDLTREWNVDTVIRALAPLVEENRDLRLWILGDSDDRTRFYDQLQFQGIHRLVSMPGVFTDLDLIFQAADLVLFPATDKGLRTLLPTCIAAAIPLLAVRSPETVALLRNHVETLTIPQGDATLVREWVSEWERDPSEKQRAVSDLRVRTHNARRSIRPPLDGLTRAPKSFGGPAENSPAAENGDGEPTTTASNSDSQSLGDCLLQFCHLGIPNLGQRVADARFTKSLKGKSQIDSGGSR